MPLDSPLGSPLRTRRGRSPYAPVAGIAIVLLLLLSTPAGGSIGATGPRVHAPPAAAPTASPSPEGQPATSAHPPPIAAASEYRGARPIAGDVLCWVVPIPRCSPRAVGAIPYRPEVSGPSSWANLTPAPFPANYPTQRFAPLVTYDAAEHSVLMFGGFAELAVPPYFQTERDTWSYSHSVWTQRIGDSDCTLTTCPSARTEGMMAFDALDQETVLFGGISNFSTYPYPTLSDTWVFSGGHWLNVTSTAGTAPSARFDGSMTYDSADGYILMFGGADSTAQALGDTWSFQHGQWRNLTPTLALTPEPRIGAALADSPSQSVMLFGGESGGQVIQNNCLGGVEPWLAWWFANGTWSPASKPTACPSRPTGAANYSADQLPPCGRVNAALAWSPQNDRFVLFGGYGTLPIGNLCQGSGTTVPLNDTWVYEGTGGGGFYPWHNDTLPGAPSPRESMGFASDYTDGYVLIFAGSSGFYFFNETWRYFEPVTAEFRGPLTLAAGSLSFNQFELDAFGGSGDLEYSLSTIGLETTHVLTGTGCDAFTNGLSYVVPSDGADYIHCTPDPTSYNIYRVTATVWDVLNTSARATANWTVTVNPPETIQLYSQYIGFFYGGFHVNNIFGVYAQIAGQPATQVTGQIGGMYLTFSHSNSSNLWWNSSAVDMGSVSPGDVVSVKAQITDWSGTASLPVEIISTPDWLQQIAGFAQAVQTFGPIGKGAFNLSYSVTQTVPLPIGKLFNFSIPVPLVSGNYSLVPDLTLVFTETSTGSVTLSGTFTLSTPEIDLGAFKLTISASVNVSGTFALTDLGSGESTLTWQSADITITIKGDFAGSFPIYGFSFDLLGATIKIGFTLDIDIAPAVALQILLAPTTESATDVGEGLGLMVTSLLGDFTLPISADVSFGIGVASVAIGGTLSVDLAFSVSPGPFAASGLWVNGSLFVKAQVLFWSGSWNLVGPGIIYHWTPSLRPLPTGAPVAAYDDGSNVTWTVSSRYYNASGYDANVWSAAGSAGPAVTNIYPSTTVSASAGYDGAYVFYGDDRVDQPERSGLTVSGVWLDSSTNQLHALPSPEDSGYITTRPVATGLPDGSLYVLWEAVPTAETGGATPAGLSSVAVHGAVFYPSNHTWGPVRAWTDTGFAESFAVDGASGLGRVAVLLSPSLIPSDSASEQLATFDLASGRLLSSVNVTGLVAIDSVRVAPGWAVVRDLEGNSSLLNLSTGAVVPFGYAAPAGSSLVGAELIPGTDGTVLLRYRTVTADRLVLYDAVGGRALAELDLGGNTTDAHALFAGGTYYLFAASPEGVAGWTLSAGVLQNGTSGNLAGATRFGIVQAGSSILLFSVETSTPGAEPVRTLALAELPADLPIVPGAPSPTTPVGGSASDGTVEYVIVLVLAAGIVSLLLAVLAVRRGRRRPTSRSPPSGPPPGVLDPPIQ